MAYRPADVYAPLMTGAAITFDFHNTLASSDPWFGLEIRTLVGDFLTWRAEEADGVADPSLVTAANAAYRRLRQAIHHHGHELPADRCVATVLENLGIEADPDEIARGIELLMRRAFASVEPVAGAVETVHALAAAGVPLGVVSSAVYHPFLEWTLDRFGIRGCFRTVTTSASVGFYKSRPEIFHIALRALGASPAQSLHVGDSLRFDVHGARRAGMRAVWLRSDRHHPPGDAAAPPHLTIATLSGSAPRLLDLLNGGG